MKTTRTTWRRRGGFTLLEVLAATAMFAAIVGAVYSVLHGALRLRDGAHETLEQDVLRDAAAAILRDDLASIVAPSGLLAGSMTGIKENSGTARRDRLELHTASGRITDAEPWGDIQKVAYELVESQDAGSGGALTRPCDLVRSATRNLLPSTTEEPPVRTLVRNVESLQFAYYDGEDWVEAWDSTTQETVLPEAVRVQIRFVVDEAEKRPALPMDLVVPIVVRPGDEATTETTSPTSPSGPQPSEPGPNPGGTGGQTGGPTGGGGGQGGGGR